MTAEKTPEGYEFNLYEEFSVEVVLCFGQSLQQNLRSCILPQSVLGDVTVSDFFLKIKKVVLWM